MPGNVASVSEGAAETMAGARNESKPARQTHSEPSGAGSLDVRLITENEVAAWNRAKNTGFLRALAEADPDPVRSGLLFDRTWAGFDGDQVVSTLRSFPVEVTLPGGRAVPADAVTGVTTAATHRRRGLATRMVTADLSAAKERGEACAVLIAMEWPIYGRYGYGPATEHQLLTVQAPVTFTAPVGPESGRVRHIDAQTSRRLAPVVWEGHRGRSAGEISRDERAWDFRYGLLQIPGLPEPKPLFHVLAEDPAGNPVGLVRYQTEYQETARVPAAELTVHELVAATEAAELMLWHHLLSVDLIGTIKAGDRPVDEPLPWWLANARSARPTERSDMLWLRPLDVPRLLSERSYWTTGSVVLEVADPLGYAAGRYRLEAAPDGASCVPTDSSADLTLSVSALASVLLGGYPLTALHAAGQADEHSAGAIERATVLLRTPRQPWCATWF